MSKLLWDLFADTFDRYGSEAVATSYGMATQTFGISIDEERSPTVG